MCVCVCVCVCVCAGQTDFPYAMAWAPGHRLELMAASAYWGTMADVSRVDHGGKLSTSGCVPIPSEKRME